MFELFDRRQEFSVRCGKLPHWYQVGVTYFVTFRTDDSVPAGVLKSWHGRRNTWLQAHGIDPVANDWRQRLARRPDDEREFHATFSREFMAYLDRGYGACPLKRADAAECVGKVLRYFDGDRYALGDFVVMPNHVHALVCLMGTTVLEEQCRSWKKFSARCVNQLLGTVGRFWQEESFDHLVRSPEQFEYFQRYIAENPMKAKLPPESFLLWRRPM